ncbi:hypothetical protein PVAND_014383 [Polypedilum vanderplanki]|uniref:Uncharacterized protein n=1 Tax=Polypedilum vanderplanki TaxID=319348 RepID=A0A9J6B988_POLVA|nr:hypothetical protein PVAND_014383 [Polypedilum vanderplanki]
MLIKFIAIFLTFFLTTAMHTRSNFYKISSESIISRNTTIEVCDNGAEPPYCCKNSAKNPDCCTNDGFGKFCCPNGSNNIFCCDDDNDNPNLLFRRDVHTCGGPPLGQHLPKTSDQVPVLQIGVLKRIFGA